MKLSNSIISGLSLTTAATSVAGTARADPNTEAPSPSWIFSDFPSVDTYVYDPEDGCPDQHGNVAAQLFQAFGRENCVYNTDDETVRLIECNLCFKYDNVDWFPAHARYEYHSYDGAYHNGWRPKYLFYEDNDVPGYGWVDWFEFQRPLTGWMAQQIENGSSCMASWSPLYNIERKRLDADVIKAPTCGDTPETPTAAPNDELTPTEQPSSWFPSSLPVEYSHPDYGCPDRHGGTVKRLYESFGRENCAYITESETVRYIRCEYTDPDWFQGSALYEYHSTEDEDFYIQYYHTNWKPIKLVVTDTNIYEYSGYAETYFATDDPPTNGRNCIDSDVGSYLNGIRSKRRRPQDAPTCEDTDGEFTVEIRGRNKSKSCDDYWKLSWKKRRNKCTKYPVVQSKCPGVCLRFNEDTSDKRCECKDNSFPFGRSGKESTCATLASYDDAKLQSECKKNKFKYNCPSICLDKVNYNCEKNF